MELEIVEVSTKKELKQFVLFPFNLYKNNKYWIPPLISDELHTLRSEDNPAFEHCHANYWLVYKGNEIVGRIAGIINKKYIEKWGNKYARFGWVDFIDDPEVSQLLFSTVESWAKSQGMTAIHGPLGFTDMDREGMLIEGFDELSTMATIYNYPYYPQHLEKLGFKKDIDWVEYEIIVPKEIPEKAVRIAKIVRERRGLRILDAKSSKDLLKYAHGIFDVINETYENLYGFVELSQKQIDLYIKQYFPFVSPNYLKIVLDEKDKVAGFVIGMPSLSRALQKAKGRLFPFGFIHLLIALKFPKYVDLYLGAVRKELQGKGADAFLITDLCRSCIEKKIISAESNLELEDNLLVQGHWKHFDRRQHKRRRCFIKELE
ncbi:MAG: hypothetical protein KJ666_03000 [Bacteroidetes bacterium]|nr:hypothetical protein [Bacteroidota bacterium]MBU2585418.1 hypothetical protein [Bacteroidota bacterium]